MRTVLSAHHLTRLLLLLTFLFAFSPFAQASPVATPLSDQEMQSLQGKGGVSISCFLGTNVNIQKLDYPYYSYSAICSLSSYIALSLANGCYRAYSRSCTRSFCIKDNWVLVDLRYCGIY